MTEYENDKRIFRGVQRAFFLVLGIHLTDTFLLGFLVPTNIEGVWSKITIIGSFHYIISSFYYGNKHSIPRKK